MQVDRQGGRRVTEHRMQLDNYFMLITGALYKDWTLEYSITSEHIWMTKAKVIDQAGESL